MEFCKVTNFWVCGRNPMMWPFKWNLSACTYTWSYLFFKILQNEICKLTRNLALASFGSERVKPVAYLPVYQHVCACLKTCWRLLLANTILLPTFKSSKSFHSLKWVSLVIHLWLHKLLLLTHSNCLLTRLSRRRDRNMKMWLYQLSRQSIWLSKKLQKLMVYQHE